MSLSLSVDGPGDAELISAVREGDVDAYGELFARHVDAARRLARQLAGPADADDLVSDAFTKVLTVLQRGGGPDLAFRAYLLTAVRRLHVDKIRAGSRLRPVDDLTPFDPGLPFQDTAVEGFDNAAAARAFASLPERWQMVLWHTEVEQQKPADIAPMLGMSANSVSALAYRAREGLRQAFLSQHATDPDDVDCGWTRDHLGAYVRGGLSRRDAKRVDDHLEECRACAAVYLELTEVNSGLAGLIAPLLLGAAGAKYASSISGGAAAGGAGTSGFAAAQSWAAAHLGLTAIGGLAVTATALAAVYGATHLKSNEAADVGSGALSTAPSATSGATPGGSSGPSGTSSRGATSQGTASPGTSSSTAGANPSSGTSANASANATASAGLPPGTDTASGTTASTTGPTDPSTGPGGGPTGPPAPGDDPITFTSVPPIDPVFGSTYQVTATSGSGKGVTFTVDATPANACSISGDIVSFDHAGTCVINASVPAKNAARSAGAGAGAGAAAHATTKVFSQTVVIPKGKQKIDFDLGKNAQVDGDQQLQASGGASGKDVTFTSDTPAVCSVNAAGTRVSFHHAQGCTVTAHQDGNEDYKPADDTSSTVNVDRGDQVIDFTSNAPDNAVVQGTPYTVSATGGRSENPVKFAVDPDVSPACTVDGSTVSFAHAGTCVVSAHQNGTDDYKPADETQKVVVGKGTQTLDFTTVPDGKVGTSAALKATSSAGIDVTFSTDSTSCTVSGDTVSYDHARACIVTASAGNADWKNASEDQVILVARGDQTVDFPDVTGAKVGTSASLKATSSAGLDVTFSTDSTSCQVSGDTVTYDHARPCVVTASAGNNDWNAASTDQTIVIAKGDQTVDFTPVTDGKVGTSSPLQATSSTGLDVTFATDDASCVVLGSTVSFAHAAPCVVTATQAGNDDWNPTSADQTIDIAKGDQSIDFTPVTGAQVGTSSTLQATSTAGLAVTFSSTSETCTVTGSTVRFDHAGPCVVTATQAGNDDWNPTSTDQTITVGKGAPHLTISVPSQAAVGGTGTVTASSDSDGAITFSVGEATTNAACTVSPGGDVAYRHAGVCEVTADQAESSDFGAATASRTFTIDKADQHIDFTLPATAKLGDSLPLTATGGASGNPVTFATGSAACTITAAGTEVRFVHAGACTVTAHQAGNDDYNDAPDVTQTVTVAKGDQKITFTLPANGKVGDSLALTAIGGPSGNPVTFTTGSSACTITASGTQVTLSHPGACTVTAHQAGNDDYNDAPDVTQTVTVAKGDQKITFTLPANGKVGDTLALTATGGPSGNPVTYTVAPDSQKVCSVSGSNLRFDHPGACRVAAHQKGNDDYNDAPEATQTVTVAKGDQRITFTSTPPSSAVVGDKYTVSATGGASGNTVTFGSSTTAVCGVSGSTVTFLKAGTCNVTANQAGNQDFNDAPPATQSITVSAAARDLTMNITTRPGLLFGIFGTIVDVQVVGLDPGAHATLEMKAHHAIALSPATCDANGSDNHADCDVTSTPTTFSFLAIILQHDADLQFSVGSKDSVDSNPDNNDQTVPLN